MKGWEKIFLENVRREKRWPYFYQKKIGFKSKSVIKDKEHYIMIKVRVIHLTSVLR